MGEGRGEGSFESIIHASAFASDRGSMNHFTADISNCPERRMSAEEEPIMAVNFPGSTTRSMLRFQIARHSGAIAKLTILVSCGFRWILSNPQSRFSHVVTELVSWRM